MIDEELLAALTPVVEAFEALAVDVQIGGSVASSALGVPRTTLDADVVCDLKLEQVPPLVAALEESYYADADMMRDAIRRRSSFNLIHYATAWKIDVFVVKRTPFEATSFRRRTETELAPGGRTFSVSTAEDAILHKLLWYRSGDEIAQRQWRDVLGIVEIRGDTLDCAYLQRWAEAIGVADLLAKALSRERPG